MIIKKKTVGDFEDILRTEHSKINNNHACLLSTVEHLCRFGSTLQFDINALQSPIFIQPSQVFQLFFSTRALRWSPELIWLG